MIIATGCEKNIKITSLRNMKRRIKCKEYKRQNV